MKSSKLLGWLAFLGAVAGPGLAHAGSYLYYAPATVAVAGKPTELYVPLAFEAHDGLAGNALADAALKELGNLLPQVTTALKVEYKDTRAVVTPAAADADTRDRALGAVYYTLLASGVTEILLDGKPVAAAAFTRGALSPVVPLASALPPRRVTWGHVQVGEALVPAAEFYQKLGAGDATVREAALALLEGGSTATKLALLEGLGALNLKDRDAVLVARLKDGADDVRLAALALLTGSKSPAVLKALGAVVDGDPNNDAKIAAVKILVGAGQQQYKRYLLLEKLKASDAATVVEAARELVAAGDAKLATAFEPLVKHSHPEVRQAGLSGLQAFKQYDRLAALVAEGQVNRDVLEPMARVLCDEESGTNQARGIAWLATTGSSQGAIHAIKVAGDKRVAGTTEAVGKAIARPEADVRLAAAQALGQLKDAAGLEPLAAAVTGTAVEAEKEAFTQAAIAIISAQPLDQVIKISESPDVTIRELALKSLVAFTKDRPNPKVVSVLKARLKDSEVVIRRAAAFSLARISDESVIAELAQLKGDPDAAIRAQVAVALTGSKHADAEKILVAFLDDVDNDVKLQAVRAVRERKIASAFEKVRWLIEYRHAPIRREVMRTIVALAQPADPAMFDIYTGRLYDEDADIRVMAIDAIAHYAADPRTAPAIGGLVSDQVAAVKLHALQVLSNSKDPNAVEQVIRGLFDTSKEVKLEALDALEKMASDKASKALQEFIINESDPDIKKRATAVLDTL